MEISAAFLNASEPLMLQGGPRLVREFQFLRIDLFVTHSRAGIHD